MGKSALKAFFDSKMCMKKGSMALPRNSMICKFFILLKYKLQV